MYKGELLIKTTVADHYDYYPIISDEFLHVFDFVDEYAKIENKSIVETLLILANNEISNEYLNGIEYIKKHNEDHNSIFEDLYFQNKFTSSRELREMMKGYIFSTIWNDPSFEDNYGSIVNIMDRYYIQNKLYSLDSNLVMQFILLLSKCHLNFPIYKLND